MPPTLDEHINQLKQTIADIESQRSILGDEVVEASLKPIRKKLADLESGVDSSTEDLFDISERKRKLVTLLFLDVVGSTAMTQDLDPEDTLDMMDHALKQLAEPVGAHAGRVTRYTGDGFKAIFGDPVSRENDPELAIRAGLEILELANCISQEIEKERGVMDFKVRIGIDTGLAAIGGQTESEDTVMGKVVNLAVRIESAAPPGGLLISHNTYRHVRGVFNVEPQEPISAKGFPEPVPVYLVKEIKPRAFRVQTRGVEGIETRMVGRNDELRFLQDALMTAFEEREGHVVTVSGEAGVGKSRLLYEFQNWLELLPSSQPVRFFQGRGKQETKNSPYSLLRDVFASRFQITDDDTGEKARNRIESGFREVLGKDEVGEMKAHILGQLLGFDFSTSPHLKGVLNDAEQLRNRGVMYLIQYFHELSQEMPVVIFLEDIHWGDDSSLDVVSRIGEYTPQHPVLLVCAARPVLFERRPYWGEGQPYHTRLELRPLSKRESRTLVSEILKLTDDIPDELRELVVKSAEGNPFYTEELIKMLIEDRVILPEEDTWQIDLTRLEEIEVPSTLAGVLQARLDSLPTHERTVLQQASVVGRLFWDRIVAYIQAEGWNNGDPQSIPHALTSLRNRELVYRHEESAFIGAVEYLFKHDVLREVTYESVLKRLRKTYHGLVADWLIANCGERIDEFSSLIAEHSVLAGNNEYACQYYLQAGEHALLTYANQEAETQFRLALSLECKEIDKPKLLEGLGESLTRQGRLEEAIQIWNEAIELNLEFDELANVARLYAKSSRASFDSGDIPRSLKICREGLKWIKDEPDSHDVGLLMHETARVYFFNGMPDYADEYCKRALQMAERLDDIEGQADGLITLGILSTTPPEEGIDALTQAVDLAEKGNLFRIAQRANQNLGVLRTDVYGDILIAKEDYKRSVAIAKQIGNIVGEFYSFRNIVNVIFDLCEVSVIERHVQSLEVIATELSDPDLTIPSFMYIKATLLGLQGEIRESLFLLRECRENAEQSGDLQNLAGIDYGIVYGNLELYWSDGEPNWQEVEEVLNELTYLGEQGITSKSSPQGLLSIVNTFRGNHQNAHYHLEAAKDYKDEFSPFWNYQTISRATAILSASEGRWEESFNAYEDLIEIFSQKGHRWAHAHTLCDWGDAHVSRGESADLEAARKLYDLSIKIYEDLEASWYVEQVEKRLKRITN